MVILRKIFDGPNYLGRLFVVGNKVRFFPTDGLGLNDAATACSLLMTERKKPVVMRFNSVKLKVPYDEKLTAKKIMDMYFELSRQKG